MEIEMKYALPSKEVADNIWADSRLTALCDMSSRESLVMKAIYFDTEDWVLARNNIAVRVRSEGDSCFATLKWGGNYKDGIHSREEINIPVDDESCFMMLPSDIFSVAEEGREMMDLIGNRPLMNLFEMRFLRRRVRLKFRGSLAELSIDLGTITSDKGEYPIRELEIELFAGDPEDIKTLGQILAERFGLKPKESSKFADGMKMIGLR
jgi:triphosphatase